MAKILFVNGNLHGHINPTLPVAAELVRRGEEVWYYCAEVFKEQIMKTGAHFIRWGKTLDHFMAGYKSSGDHPFFSLLEYIIRYDNAMLPELMESISGMRFDCVICDSILGGGYFLKHMLKIPMICSNSSFAMDKLPVPDRMMAPGFHPQLDYVNDLIHRECQRWNIPEASGYDLFISKGDLNLVYTSEVFNSEGSSLDDTYKFCGPSIASQTFMGDALADNGPDAMTLSLDKLGAGKVIYISLGTINTDFIAFYRICIEAFRDSEYRVVMSVGRKCDITSLGEIPDNYMVFNFVPQLEVLKRTSVFISHGGFNSVSEALYHGVPVIAIPMVNDQHMVAKHLTRVGAGLALKMADIAKPVLKDAVERVLSDSSFKEAADRISWTFRSAGGYERAADYIMALMEET
jgi:MGT family glycosyltransferase